jgi:hypothetical protein
MPVHTQFSLSPLMNEPNETTPGADGRWSAGRVVAAAHWIRAQMRVVLGGRP